MPSTTRPTGARFLRRVAGYTRTKLVFDFNPRAQSWDEIERDLREGGFGQIELTALLPAAAPRCARARCAPPCSGSSGQGPLARAALRVRGSLVLRREAAVVTLSPMDRADKELNKAHYDENAADDRVRAHAEANRLHSLELVVPWVVSLLGPGTRLIDIAGGSGAHASQIVRASSIDVVGVDISETMIRQRTEDPLLRENLVADMEALPFDAETFDGAMFVAALHHVPDPLPALREAWRVLRPGGQLFVYEPNSLRAGAGSPEPLPEHPKEFRVGVSYLSDRIRAAGFDVDDVRTKRIALRLVELFTESAPLAVYHAGDRVDGILCLIPRLRLLGTMAMVHATKRPF